MRDETTPTRTSEKFWSRDFVLIILINLLVFINHIMNLSTFPFYVESLGGTETLFTYPITQTHADVPKELLEKNGLTDRVLRLSVGIENADDLIAEFERVFAAAEKE